MICCLQQAFIADFFAGFGLVEIKAGKLGLVAVFVRLEQPSTEKNGKRQHSNMQCVFHRITI